MSGEVLVLNAGSSSLKAAIFAADLNALARLSVTGIGGDGRLVRAGAAPQPVPAPDHDHALAALFRAVERDGFALTEMQGIGHRVVHGGPHLTEAMRLTPGVRDQIAAAIPLAPLHNPHHLAAIDAVARLAPGVPQVAAFDTAFHATNPDVARRYALPACPETDGLRRYGFHGLSYAALVARLPAQTGAPLPRRLLALHLGNGASLAAIRDGRSVATTMGYSPLSGLTMGTRSGDIDPLAVIELVRRTGGPDAAADLLAHESGLLGLSGECADMQGLATSDRPEARFARAHFAYWVARHAGSMIAALQGLDAIAFTGGIGENDMDMVERIVTLLAWTGNVPVHIVPADEEKHIAREILALTA